MIKKILLPDFLVRQFFGCVDTTRNVRIAGGFFMFQGKNPQAYFPYGKDF